MQSVNNLIYIILINKCIIFSKLIPSQWHMQLWEIAQENSHSLSLKYYVMSFGNS